MQGADDNDILARSIAQQRVLVTFDKDFGEMAFRQGKKATHGIILMRPWLRDPTFLSRFMLAVLSQPVDASPGRCSKQTSRNPSGR